MTMTMFGLMDPSVKPSVSIIPHSMFCQHNDSFGVRTVYKRLQAHNLRYMVSYKKIGEYLFFKTIQIFRDLKLEITVAFLNKGPLLGTI